MTETTFVQPTKATFESDHSLVDSVIYLASLASEVDTIDPMLDTLRHVTARWNTKTPLANDDRMALEKLITDLKEYLVNRDPIRSFTKQELDDRLQKNLENKDEEHTKLNFNFSTAVIGSIFLAAATILIPSGLDMLDRVYLALPMFLMLVTFSNAWFYLSALRNFKPELRQVFGLICSGIVGFGVQFFHYIFIPLSGESDWPIFRYGGLPFITFVSFALFYLGLRKYAALLSIKSAFMSLRLLGLCIALTTLAAPVVAYALPVADKGFFMFALGSVLGLPIFSLFGLKIAKAITKSVTRLYNKSIRILYIFLVSVFYGSFGYALSIAVFGGLSGKTMSIVLGISSTIPLLLLLYSGSSFKKETSQ